jgi:uncharacterized protein (DUF1501 family)
VSPLVFEPNMGITISSDKAFYDFIDNTTSFPSTYGGERMKYVYDTRMASETYSIAIKEAAGKITSQLEYPDTEVAKQLKIVARLIAGGMTTKAYMVSMTGFDTHSGQVNSGDASTGVHAYLLKELSEAIAAFIEDCKYLGIFDRVFGMTFSEFGRTVKSNGSFGTDHGVSAPLFYFGKNLNSNRIIGNSPTLDVNTNVIPFEFDFRQVYASILKYQEVNNTAEILFREFSDLPMFSVTNPPIPSPTPTPSIPTQQKLYEMVLHKEGKHIVVYSDNTWSYL